MCIPLLFLTCQHFIPPCLSQGQQSQQTEKLFGNLLSLIEILGNPLSFSTFHTHTVSVLGRDKGYTVKYYPLPEAVPKGQARGNS